MTERLKAIRDYEPPAAVLTRVAVTALLVAVVACGGLLWVLGAQGRATHRLEASESTASINRVISVDQRCSFSAKSTAAHAATASEFREILKFLDRVGIPRAQTSGLRRGAEEKARRVADLRRDVAACYVIRDRYFAELSLVERREYARRSR